MDKRNSYLNSYKNGLIYFDADVSTIINGLTMQRCIAVTSARRMGTKRFFDYLAHRIKENTAFEVYYDVDNSFSPETIAVAQSANNKQAVLLLPWFAEMSPTFLRAFSRLMQTKQDAVLSVISVDADFCDKPEIYLKDTAFRAAELLVTRMPLSESAILSLLDTRCQIDNRSLDQQQVNAIFKHSGGNIGIIKRMYDMATLQQIKLSEENLLRDPSMKLELLALEHQLRTLTTQTLQRIGIISNEGAITIPLLKAFTRTITDKFSSVLPPRQQSLLSLFQQRANHIVSINDIQQLLYPSEEYSMWRIYKTMARFGAAIKQQYTLRSIRGKGYQLVENF